VTDYPAFAALGISRHRLFRDGQGVTTLVAGYGCPLACRYCINMTCRDPAFRPKRFTPPALYERLCVDDLYFEATNGGVTFGGGEPLLQSPFLRAFIDYVLEAGKTWRFAVETSLAVPEENLAPLLPGPGEEPFVREWIVDVKDMNPDLYEAYTAKSPALLRHNLEILAARCPDTVTLRLPLIPGFNTDADRDRSEKELRAMGFKNFDRFDYILPEKP
jgi:pyruvate formate lyase activating enzyme